MKVFTALRIGCGFRNRDQTRDPKMDGFRHVCGCNWLEIRTPFRVLLSKKLWAGIQQRGGLDSEDAAICSAEQSCCAIRAESNRGRTAVFAFKLCK